jgi:cytochrome c oxidase subunit 5b
MKQRKRGKGTKEEPNIVDAMDVYRMVGCVCHEDQTHINWMWVYENEPKRCECGYWFKLKKHPAPEHFKLPL